MGLVLDWVLRAQTPDGGIRAFGGDSQVYPEVTGYMIPTLIAYGEIEAAFRCAEYLLTVQQDDGSFLGLDGVKRTFDTAACVEGLLAADRAAVSTSEDEYYSDKFRAAAWRALDWLKEMRAADGRLYTSPDGGVEFYGIRASAIMGDKKAIRAWANFEPPVYYRLHYLMYAAEGFQRMHKDAQVSRLMGKAEACLRRDGLLAFDVRNGEPGSSDICASAQMGLIYVGQGHHKNAEGLLNAIIPWIGNDGGVPVMAGAGGAYAWAAKFVLDLAKALE